MPDSALENVGKILHLHCNSQIKLAKDSLGSGFLFVFRAKGILTLDSFWETKLDVEKGNRCRWK